MGSHALAGIEPALLAELDFESSYVYDKILIIIDNYQTKLRMCKRLCKNAVKSASLFVAE
jgi:hypothetical protein